SVGSWLIKRMFARVAQRASRIAGPGPSAGEPTSSSGMTKGLSRKGILYYVILWTGSRGQLSSVQACERKRSDDPESGGSSGLGAAQWRAARFDGGLD